MKCKYAESQVRNNIICRNPGIEIYNYMVDSKRCVGCANYCDDKKYNIYTGNHGRWIWLDSTDNKPYNIMNDYIKAHWDSHYQIVNEFDGYDIIDYGSYTDFVKVVYEDE